MLFLQVGFSEILGFQDLMHFQDYLERKEDAVEVVVITEDDDNAESSWLQKRHVDKHISDFMPVIDPVNNVLHPNEINTAGNSHAKFETRKGTSPSSSILDMVHMIYIKMKIEEISADKTYAVVNLGDRTFILTLRLAYYKNHKDLLRISNALKPM